jgi:hypothetical protein
MGHLGIPVPAVEDNDAQLVRQYIFWNISQKGDSKESAADKLIRQGI